MTIGDSVASAIAYDQTAQATLGRGADLSLQLAPCRRVGQTSCPHNGTTAPNVLQLIPTLGDTLAGSTVIVAVGYNDYEQEYARNIEDALVALRGAGVQRVLWVTLRAERRSYLAMNEMIRTASARHPELTVVDWNVYARSHAGAVPAGLRLSAAGRLTGTPAVRGRFTFVVRVTDASRTSATRRVVVQIA